MARHRHKKKYTKTKTMEARSKNTMKLAQFYKQWLKTHTDRWICSACQEDFEEIIQEYEKQEKSKKK